MTESPTAVDHAATGPRTRRALLAAAAGMTGVAATFAITSPARADTGPAGMNAGGACVRVVDDVAALVASDFDAGTMVRTRSYWGVAGDGRGGALYVIADTADFTGSPDGFGDHELTNGRIAVLDKTHGLYATQYGARGDDGATDSYPQLSAIMLQLKKQGGGTAVLDWAGGAYGISETLQLWNSSTLTGPNWLKIIDQTTYDCAVLGVPGANYLRVEELKVDCGNIPAQGGLYLRRNNASCHVGSVTVRNASHDKTRKGGRAVTIEAGVNPDVYGSRKAVVGSIIAIDCYMALALCGGTNQEESGVVVQGVVAERCEVVVGLFGNAAGFPHVGRRMQHLVQGVIARNCGASTTYSRPHGLIVSDRGSNVTIDAFNCANDSGYGTIGAVAIGDFHGVRLTGVSFEGDAVALVRFARFFERDVIEDDVFATTDSEFEVRSRGALSTLATASAVNKVSDVLLTADVSATSDAAVLATELRDATGLYLKVARRDLGTRVEGFAESIDDAEWSDHAGAAVLYGVVSA